MNTLPAIMTALLSVLRVDHGSLDLSDDNQVQRGTFDRPVGSRDFCGVGPPARVSSVPFGRGPDWYDETYVVELRLWSAVNNATSDARAARADLIVAEVQQSLDNAKAGGNITLFRTWKWEVRQVTPHPASPNDLPGYAHARLRLEFQFKRASGTGA